MTVCMYMVGGLDRTGQDDATEKNASDYFWQVGASASFKKIEKNVNVSNAISFAVERPCDPCRSPAGATGGDQQASRFARANI